MINNIPAAYYWLGLSKDPNDASIIRDLDGQVLDENPIIWSANEPNDPIGQPILAVSAYMDNQRQYVHYIVKGAQLGSICDMK